MIVGIPIVLLLAAGGGFWLASIGLRPITDMAQQAARISVTGIENLGPADRTDELGQFARAFNGLVARLRAALQTQRQFMADASHELRTPVSVVRTAADVTLGREHRSEAEYREALAIVGDQSRRLGRLVEDMLVLARADAGGYPLRPVDLYLDEVVADCRRAVEVLAAERAVTITWGASAEIPFRGDEDLLRQLVLNVLQNAVQHTPPGGSVAVEMCRDAGALRIRVSDTGHGIPAADQARIFDRFVQLDPVPPRTWNGSGSADREVDRGGPPRGRFSGCVAPWWGRCSSRCRFFGCCPPSGGPAGARKSSLKPDTAYPVKPLLVSQRGHKN